MKTRLFSILFLILGSTKSFATINYLTVNHITKQLYWAETDHPTGLIGWEGVGEVYEAKEKGYLNMGYTYTKNPFLIEEVILLFIVTSLITYWFVRNRKRKNALQQGV